MFLLSSCSLLQFEVFDVISVLKNSIECSFVFFIKVFSSWARSSYSFDKKLKSIEKKLIIVKNREGLNSTIYCDLLSEKTFVLNDKVSDYSQTRLYSKETEIALIFSEGSVAGVCCIPKVYQRNQSKSKGNEQQFNIAGVGYILCSL